MFRYPYLMASIVGMLALNSHLKAFAQAVKPAVEPVKVGVIGRFTGPSSAFATLAWL
jgi:hypothetical protein